MSREAQLVIVCAVLNKCMFSIPESLYTEI